MPHGSKRGVSVAVLSYRRDETSMRTAWLCVGASLERTLCDAT